MNGHSSLTSNLVIFESLAWLPNDNVYFITTTVAPPTISNDPDDLIVPSGSPAVFIVMTTGEDITHQWFKGTIPLVNTDNIGGADTNTLTLSPAVGDAGVYHVQVTNAAGMVNSSAATLTVGKNVHSVKGRCH